MTSHVPPENRDSPYAECTEVTVPVPVYGNGSANRKVYKATPTDRIGDTNLWAAPKDIQSILNKLNEAEKNKALE